MGSKEATPKQVNRKAPVSGMKTGELPSVEVLRERILRRIMRVTCVAGVFGMLAGVAFVHPLDVAALAIAIVATVVVFGLTMLPEQRRLASTVYPWALVIVGVRGPAVDLGFRLDHHVGAGGASRAASSPTRRRWSSSGRWRAASRTT
jgi:hypothetical protein